MLFGSIYLCELGQELARALPFCWLFWSKVAGNTSQTKNSMMGWC